MPWPEGVELTEDAARAWVLDALERLEDREFVFAMSSLGALLRALLVQESRPDTAEVSEAIEVYLGTRGVTLPF